jgi:acetoacetyl-CoA synthetase
MAASPVWTHPYATGTNVNAFRDYVNRTHSLNLRDYKELHAWSVADIDVFAWAIWAFCGIKYSTPPTAAALGLENMYPRPEWFPRARMNYSENMLALGLSSRPDSIAVTVCQEGGLQIEEYTFKQLETEVARWTNALRSMGIGVGDRITSMRPSSSSTPNFPSSLNTF